MSTCLVQILVKQRDLALLFWKWEWKWSGYERHSPQEHDNGVRTALKWTTSGDQVSAGRLTTHATINLLQVQFPDQNILQNAHFNWQAIYKPETITKLKAKIQRAIGEIQLHLYEKKTSIVSWKEQWSVIRAAVAICRTFNSILNPIVSSLKWNKISRLA